MTLQVNVVHALDLHLAWLLDVTQAALTGFQIFGDDLVPCISVIRSKAAVSGGSEPADRATRPGLLNIHIHCKFTKNSS
jgi:hypothetical protein